MESVKVLLNVPKSKYKLPVEIFRGDPRFPGKLRLSYPFSREFNAEIKAMRGYKWHGFDNEEWKFWTVDDCARNWFSIRYMSGEKVYQKYDDPVARLDAILYPHSYPHQIDDASDVLVKRRKIWAHEMGTCKTYAAIVILERSGFKSDEWWWVGTNSSLREMTREFRKWKSNIWPEFMTYDQLKKIVENWPKGKKAPKGVIFDEFSKCKTWTTQRTVAASHLSEAIEKDWGDEGIVLGMTGTPSPKDPTDWWALCEIIKPGFLKEGNVQAFKQRLGLTIKKQGDYGVYPEHVTWWDDENKCAVCGNYEKYTTKSVEDNRSNSDLPLVKYHAHDMESAVLNSIEYHQFKKSTNEIKKLYERMRGLVSVRFKRDVLKFLPEKRYHEEILTPDQSTLRAARTIMNTSPSTIVALTKLRELSDGFQYIEVADGTQPCEACKSFGVVAEYFDKSDPDKPIFNIPADRYDQYEKRSKTCPTCEGKKEVTKYRRDLTEVPSPKDDYFVDLMDLHEDSGRLICFAGFTASIDRCINTAHKNGWATIRVDSRGWVATDYQNNRIPVEQIFSKDKGDPYLQLFQDAKDKFPRVCFIGHPKSGGVGLTLTASPGCFFFSNSFDGEDRWQGEDRGHRPGMDLNKGYTVYDVFHLPTDRLVHNNLAKKKNLMNMTLGVFKEVLNAEPVGERRV